MYQRRYDKVYLMLRQETGGYGIGHRTPWGSCTMEIKNGKGHLHLQVQGLMPLHQKAYTVYVLAEKEKECHAIQCGQLPIDKHGSGSLNWDFLADDLDSIYQVEDLFALTILTHTNGKIVAPLTAYFGTPRKWLSRLHLPQTTEKTDLIAAEAIDRPTACPPPMQTAPAAMPYLASSAPKEDQAQDNPTSYHGDFRGLLQKFRQEMQELTEMGILSAEESSRILGYDCTQNTISFANDTAHTDASSAAATTEPIQPSAEEAVPHADPDFLSQEAVPHADPDFLSQEVPHADPSFLPQEAVPTKEHRPPEHSEACSDNEHLPVVPQETDTKPVICAQDSPANTEQNLPLPQPQNNPQSEQSQIRAKAAALQNSTPEHTPQRPKDGFFAALEILHSRPATIPFHDQCTWRCITLQDLVLFPSVPLEWQKEPFLLLTMAKYGHLLLRREGACFLLGVPDTYSPENTNCIAQFGLTTFQKLNPNRPEGYWLGVLPQ